MDTPNVTDIANSITIHDVLYTNAHTLQKKKQNVLHFLKSNAFGQNMRHSCVKLTVLLSQSKWQTTALANQKPALKLSELCNSHKQYNKPFCIF